MPNSVALQISNRAEVLLLLSKANGITYSIFTWVMHLFMARYIIAYYPEPILVCFDELMNDGSVFVAIHRSSCDTFLTISARKDSLL